MSFKLLVLSSVLPSEAGGGQIVLRRHLLRIDTDRWEVHLAFAGQSSDLPLEWPCHRVSRFPLPERLRKTRLAPRLNDLVFSGLFLSRSSLFRLVDKLRPNVILTVAHGEFAPLAAWVSRKCAIPLVTLFHDWWPDIVPCTVQGRQRIAEQFAELGRVSDSALCVCQGMADELGGECRSELLYPIPGSCPVPGTRHWLGRIEQGGPLRLAYSGNLAGAYGVMVAQLVQMLGAESSVDFQFCSASNDDPRWTAVPGYKGRMPSDQYRDFLGRQHLLLVIMSFEARDHRRTLTSFPSKLVEYCQTGLPILIWAPEASSAVRWARQADSAEVVTDAQPEAVVHALSRLHSNPGRIAELALRSAASAEREFHPDQIQKQFELSLDAAASRPSS